jgi:Tol biopolymer transport system component
MTRFVFLSLGFLLLFSAITSYIVFSQRRDFPQQGRIVFEMGHRDYSVYSVQPNSSFGEQIRLVFNPQNSFEDRFVTGVDCSPDSRSLIFWYIFLYRYDIATYNLTRLVVGDGLSQQSVWSPDGQMIAYLDNLANGPTRDIFAIDADGSNKTQLTETTELETSLAWSPDSARLAFSYRQSASSTEHGLSILELAAGDVTPLYDSPQRIGDVAWSPDGSRIAFSMIDDMGGASSIYTIQSDGTQLTRLNGAAQYNIMPRWSPDGSLISFSARESNGSYALYVMNADGTAPYQVFLGLPGEDVFNRCWLDQPSIDPT